MLETNILEYMIEHKLGNNKLKCHINHHNCKRIPLIISLELNEGLEDILEIQLNFLLDLLT